MRTAVVTTLLVAMVWLGGCSSDSSDEDVVADDQPVATAVSDPAEPEAAGDDQPADAGDDQPAPTAAPTATPEPGISPGARVDATLAGIGRDGFEDIVFADLLDVSVGDDGLVTLSLCGWNGDSAFDRVYRSLWETEMGPDGGVIAREFVTSVDAGECLNTTLVDSVLAFVRAYDEYEAGIAADPTSFDPAGPGADLMTETFFAGFSEGIQEAAAAGETRVPGSTAPLPGSEVDSIMWTRSREEAGTSFEIVACREMDPDNGVYVDGVLIDDFREGTGNGPHAITRYELVPDPQAPHDWRIRDIDALSWADCFTTGDWPSSVGIWQPGHQWAELVS